MGVTQTTPIDTTAVDLETARLIEAAEARAWADLYAAAPADFAERAGLGYEEIAGALVLRWAATGRRYFSRTVGLGVLEPATPEAVDRILEIFRDTDITMFLLQSLPHCQPAEYEGWLRKRGLEPFDAQDRVVRGGELAPVGALNTARDLRVQRVDADAADEWVAFLERVYRLETGRWLQGLVGRKGWHPYVAREQGEIVAARTMFIGPDGFAWWGMDGPVPGLGTDDYGPDAALCEFMLRDGLELGVRCFLADLEAAAEGMDTPAYGYFEQLGFTRPYVRTHFARI